MGFSTVYACLQELFPQVDARLLKAVAIENSKDPDAAVGVILSEIIPSMTESTKLPSEGSGSGSKSFSDDEAQDDEQSLNLRRHRASERMQVSHVESKAPPRNDDMIGHISSSSLAPTFVDLASFWDTNVASHDDDKLRDSSIFEEPVAPKAAEESIVHLDQTSGDQSKTPVFSDGAAVFDEANANNVDSEELILLGLTGKTGGNTGKIFIDLEGKDFDESESTIMNTGPLAYHHGVFISETDHLQKESNTFPTSSVQKDPMQTLIEEISHNSVEGQAYCDTPITENSRQEGPSCEGVIYNDDDKADVAFDLPDVQSSQNGGDVELTRSAQIGGVHLLEQIIEDAKNNKKTLFLAMESIMGTMKEAEAQEIAAKKAKEEAALAGLEIYSKVEELQKTLARAKEGNDMHAGEVYGERAILATEVRELQSRLLSLSDERDMSLAILDEMRAGLEIRLAAAEKLIQESELEKLAKQESARSALMEQEALMEKVVQESKRLQDEAEENSKLREFLMDRGRIVDTLQGEIAVICQDVKLLKEKFESGVSLSKSISSGQTTCILASSSSSSMESSHSERTGFWKSPEKLSPSHAPSVNSSPQRACEEEEEKKELVVVDEEGWELCEDDGKEF